jgi:DNA polymerase I
MKSLVSIKPHPITRILSFDLEWSLTKDKYDEYPILAAGFCDSQGYNQAFLLEDFLTRRGKRKDAEKSLLFRTTSIINKYDWSVGFYSTGIRAFNPIKHRVMGRDSDLIQLHRRLERYNLKSPIYISEYTKMPYLTGENNNHTHLDAYNLFTNKVIKSSIYNNAYNSHDLDTISRVILGNDKEGKYEGLSGPIFESLTNLDEKRMYVYLDAKLVMDCVSHSNYELLKVMNSISLLTGIPFKNVCNSRGVTKIWTPVLDNLVRKELSELDGVNGTNFEALRYDALSNYYIRDKEKEIDLDENNEDENSHSNKKIDNGPRYIGGWIMSPIPEEYKNVSVFDITSLYPSMIVNNNISFETVNCSCCSNIKQAKVPNYLFEQNKSNCHICIKHEGILTKQIADYMSKRIEYKQKSKEKAINLEQAREYEIISNAYKILINSVYGQMGHKFAKYENVLAAELVTRYGRSTIQHCAKIAKEIFKWDIIYGDTDSLFINNSDTITKADIQIFIDTCKKQLNINMELDKIYNKFLIAGAKNYVGIVKDSKKLIVKGLAGKKSDRCLWVRNCFKQMLEDYKNDIDPCIKLRDEITKLESGRLENIENQLIIFKQLNKNVDEYKINVVQKLIGKEKNLEEGDTVRYYIVNGSKENGNTKYTENVAHASIKEYKKQLINTVKPILKLLGIDVKKELDTTNINIKSSVVNYQVALSLKSKSTIKNIKPKTGLDKYQLIQI